MHAPNRPPHPAFYAALPPHWRAVLDAAGGFGPGSFRSVIAVHLDDGSTCLFYHAHAATDAAAGDVAVFSEHAGYHVFPLAGTRVRVLARTPGPTPARPEAE